MGRRWQSSRLWRQPAFLKLWGGQTTSLVGSQVTYLALPLAATLKLHASALQMGLLTAMAALPYPLFGLLAGVWVDRRRRRPILIAGALGQAVILASLPIASFIGALSMIQLYLVAFLAGSLAMFFNIAWQAFIPSVVEGGDLVDANAKLEMSQSLAEVGGPGMAGLLIQLLSAARAIGIDALSFLVSAVSLLILKVDEERPEHHRSSIRTEIREGVLAVFSHKLLRPIVIVAACFGFSAALGEAVYILYVVRRLDISPGLLGLIYTAGSVLGLAGTSLVANAGRRLGLGRTLILGQSVKVVAAGCLALASGSHLTSVPLLIAGEGGFALGIVLYNVPELTLRQTVLPSELQGRASACVRVVSWGVRPAGALLGGLLGGLIGLHPTLVVSAVGMLLAFGWLLTTPVRQAESSSTMVLTG